MTNQRGKVYAPDAYAQGKMLDHSGWAGRLPRRITPSDVDMVIDNAGSIIYGELSSRTDVWTQIEYGQRLMYWDIIRGTSNIAVLLKHSVPKTEMVRTDCDIKTFSIMFDTGLRQPGYRQLAASILWPDFVDKWFCHGAVIVLRHLRAEPHTTESLFFDIKRQPDALDEEELDRVLDREEVEESYEDEDSYFDGLFSDDYDKLY